MREHFQLASRRQVAEPEGPVVTAGDKRFSFIDECTETSRS